MIYLVHHAHAEAPEIDPQRPLTDTGRRHAVALAREAAARGVTPAVIWHSGKLRARQTAECFRVACNPAARMAAVRGLQPADPPEWIRDRLAGEVADVMLVGHMPSLPRILNTLLGGPEDAAAEFPLHGLVAVEAVGDGWVDGWRIEIPDQGSPQS